MSDIGDMFAATKDLRKEDSRKRRSRNKGNSAVMLNKNHIGFDVKNDGTHLIVKHNGMVVDFWPTTGKFNVRGDKRYFRGVKLLIKVVRGDYSEAQFKALEGE